MLSDDGRRWIQIHNSLRSLSEKSRMVLQATATKQRRRVECLETGRIFNSLTECAAHYDTTVQALKYRIKKGLWKLKII